MNTHYLVIKREFEVAYQGHWFLVNTFKDKGEAEFEIDSERQSGCKAKDIKLVVVTLEKDKRLKQSDIKEVLNKVNGE